MENITIADIEYIFNYYNDIIFKGALRPIPCRLSSAKRFLGQLRYRRRANLFGVISYDNFELAISLRNCTSREILEDTIIHEMIHYYILSNKLRDTSSHGKIFRKMMSDINKEFGRNITISHKSSTEDPSADVEIHQHYFCISKFKDGRTGITVVAKTKLLNLWHACRKYPEIVEYKWYVSTNPYFNRYRRSLTLKIYLITQEDVEKYVSSAVELTKSNLTY